METHLMYVGITHETAVPQERAYYSLSEPQKLTLLARLKEQFALRGIALLATCNRTELYLETDRVSAEAVRDALICYVESLHGVALSKLPFRLLDGTADTVQHMLEVANGLRSAVLGDKQIIGQLKDAYQQALRLKNQGTLLERAFQAAFRSHKRVHRETQYQQGSTSTAYSALKMAETHFGKPTSGSLAVLVVGAGEIAEDVLRYLPKFAYRQVSLANRTEEKARALAQRYGVTIYRWSQLERGDFTDYDVVITAVSHRKGLISQIQQDERDRLWIDLAMPTNVDPTLANARNTVYNLDEVTEQVMAVSQAQHQAIPVVKQILEEEVGKFMSWLVLRNRARHYQIHTGTQATLTTV
ncbi:MAG: glutamyl-tRNA reductase [Bacteroidota bacterium]